MKTFASARKTSMRLRYLLPLWIAVYLIGCVIYPEPDECPDGTPATTWCGCEPPILGDDC